MKAMAIRQIGSLDNNPQPLEPIQLPVPEPQGNEILLRVRACTKRHTVV